MACGIYSVIQQAAYFIGLLSTFCFPRPVKCGFHYFTGALSRNYFSYLRCVAAEKMIYTRLLRFVFQKPVRVAGKQVHVPLERHAKARFALLRRRLAVRKEYFQFADLRQRTEPWRLVLDRMTGEDAEAHELKSRNWENRNLSNQN